MHNLEIIIERIKERHQGDVHQLNAIFSPSKRLLIEAPAGYGKTNTMISKIAYMIATRKIPTPKKLLALTFSVNAAYKIKRDVTEQVPHLLGTTKEVSISNKVTVSNYHGFCRGVLKKYGYLLNPNLFNIDTFHSIDDSEEQKTQSIIETIPYEKALLLAQFNQELKKKNKTYIEENISVYCKIVLEYLTPKNYTTHNSILTLTKYLFELHPQVLSFYTKYYSALLVDEFQDTNILSFEILNLLITSETQVVLLGDSLQRIYGFIGAIENILNISSHKFNMETIKLEKNYRFSSNQEMLLLDNIIRENAKKTEKLTTDKECKIHLKIYPDQKTEAWNVARFTKQILEKYPNKKIAILVKQRNKNTNLIIEELDNQNVPYFYALFTDSDPDYILFHNICLEKFIDIISTRDIISKRSYLEHINFVKKSYSPASPNNYDSMILLLEAFWLKVFNEFSSFDNDEKIFYIKDTFEHYGLKQHIGSLNIDTIISTIHGAKGLEWDYIILPDMEQDSFPNYNGMCSSCNYRTDCNFTIDKENETKFLEELSVFYVAVTRAKNQVLFTASKFNYNNIKKNLSCFLKLPGIKYY